MPTKPQNPEQAERRQHAGAQLQAAIGAQVLHSLGQPDDLHRVQVRPLWEHHYRVNVLIGKEITSTRIAHSYFLVVDGDGKIVRSVPGVVKQY